MKDKQRQELPVRESVYDLAEFIALAHCKDQWLYRIRSRNLTLGVFRKDQNGFVGIREKFGYEYLFVEKQSIDFRKRFSSYEKLLKYIVYHKLSIYAPRKYKHAWLKKYFV